MIRHAGAFLASAALVALPVAPEPAPVLATDASEADPAPGRGYLAWTESTSQWPFQVYVRRGGGEKVLVNEPGTFGFAGGIDGTTVVYAERTARGAPSDIRFYDLARGTRTSAPAEVNTAHNEFRPSLSGDWLLFGRRSVASGPALHPILEQQAAGAGRPSWQVLLYNRATGELRRLDRARGAYMQPGGVAGRYAVWASCPTFLRCTVHRYDIAARRKQAIPNPLGRAQYAASVTAAGTVYFAESRSVDCGPELRIWRYALEGPRTALVSFPDALGVFTTAALAGKGGRTTVFYDRYDCRSDLSDVYEVVDR